MWGWAGKDLEELADTGVTISSMTGYLRGSLGDPDGGDELVRTARLSLEAAERIDCPRLNVHGTGLDERGLPVAPAAVVTPGMWLTAARTLGRLAELGERAGRVFTLENLNTAVDHPGTPFARAADTIALVEAVGSPYVRLNLDLYHAQIGEGNLIGLVERARPLIGEIQVADVPGRQEPGTGEIHYPAVADALRRIEYDGVVGLEGWASDGDSERALERFRQAFSPAGEAESKAEEAET
ncbi:TIM barrel protein [Actinoplanes bogorensis]|uniref:TIM barrel protein n=2 Tax=Paractinoplanes bogorensis TaxID=1610840 RepID=A0ABS5Z5H9_9ACTN|nr:TIM barrel protein [Actinoplanes bogorensis]